MCEAGNVSFKDVLVANGVHYTIRLRSVFYQIIDSGV